MLKRCAGVALLLATLLLAGCISAPREADIPNSPTAYTVYFIYQGWHTSLLLEAEPVRRYSRHLQADLAQQRYVRIGWGDGDYFTGKRKSTGSATKALFFSGYSALQVLPYRQPPFAHIPAQTRVPLALGEAGMRQLVAYIDGSIALDQQGMPLPLPAYAANTGSFYHSRHRYGLFSNCNSWSGRALQAAGLPVRSRLALTAQGVFGQAQAISRLQQRLGQLPYTPAGEL